MTRWFVIDARDNAKFETLVNEKLQKSDNAFHELGQACFPSIKFLKQNHIRFYTFLQSNNEIVLMFPNLWNLSVNLGSNIVHWEQCLIPPEFSNKHLVENQIIHQPKSQNAYYSQLFNELKSSTPNADPFLNMSNTISRMNSPIFSRVMNDSKASAINMEMNALSKFSSTPIEGNPLLWKNNATSLTDLHNGTGSGMVESGKLSSLNHPVVTANTPDLPNFLTNLFDSPKSIMSGSQLHAHDDDKTNSANVVNQNSNNMMFTSNLHYTYTHNDAGNNMSSNTNNADEIISSRLNNQHGNALNAKIEPTDHLDSADNNEELMAMNFSNFGECRPDSPRFRMPTYRSTQDIELYNQGKTGTNTTIDTIMNDTISGETENSQDSLSSGADINPKSYGLNGFVSRKDTTNNEGGNTNSPGASNALNSLKDGNDLSRVDQLFVTNTQIFNNHANPQAIHTRSFSPLTIPTTIQRLRTPQDMKFNPDLGGIDLLHTLDGKISPLGFTNPELFSSSFQDATDRNHHHMNSDIIGNDTLGSTTTAEGDYYEDRSRNSSNGTLDYSFQNRHNSDMNYEAVVSTNSKNIKSPHMPIINILGSTKRRVNKKTSYGRDTRNLTAPRRLPEGDPSEYSKDFVCIDCEKRFSSNHHLRRHKKSVHSAEKPFPCPKCGKKFKRRDHVLQHLHKKVPCTEELEAGTLV